LKNNLIIKLTKIGCSAEDKKVGLCDLCEKNINLWDNMENIKYWEQYKPKKKYVAKKFIFSCDGFIKDAA